MISEDFFDRLKLHFDNNLPFVAYRKPNGMKVNALLQKNNALHTIKNFTESGFVFAPFDNKKDTILIPFKDSEHVSNNFSISVKPENYSFKSDITTEDKSNHINLVIKAIEVIKSGKLKKVVLSRQETVEVSESNPIEIFKSILNIYPSAFVYCWYHPNVGLWLGASPETLLRIDNNLFSTMALAGTQAYNDTIDVTWGSKEIEEQQLVVRDVVKSLQSSLKTIKISNTETVKAGNLLHLQTKVTGILDVKTLNFKNLLFGLHPTPAVCGLPKEEAKQFILKNESYNREFYTGFMGELNLKKHVSTLSSKRNIEARSYGYIKKTSHLFVNLRCVQLKEKQALVYVGGGITRDSIPENEWEETVIKTFVMKKVL